MEDVKRATGRTTRMLVAAVMHKKTYPNDDVVVVVHNRSAMLNLQTQLHHIFSDTFIPHIKWNYFYNYKIVGSSKDTVFYDHHCFYDEVLELRAKLKVAESEYTRYDL